MNPAKFSLLLGVGLLAFLFVATLYVVWTRIVGMEPTVAQRYAALPQPVQVILAVGTGTILGSVSVAAPTVQVGAVSMVLLATSTFAALMLFELVQQRQPVAS